MPIYLGSNKIIPLYLGANKISKAYIGNNLVYKKSRLPSKYQEVEYLISTGTQYLDLGTFLNSRIRTEIYFSIQPTSLRDFGIFGTRNTNGAYGLQFWNDNNKFVFYCNANLSKSSEFGTREWNTDYSVIFNQIDKSTLINGIRYTNANMEDFNTLLNCPLFKFSADYNIPANATIKYAKFSDNINNAVIREVIPCYLKSDLTKHTAGMYDLVTNTFFENKGTGYFMVGNDV